MLDNYYYFFLKRPKTVYADFHMCTLFNKKKKKNIKITFDHLQCYHRGKQRCKSSTTKKMDDNV